MGNKEITLKDLVNAYFLSVEMANYLVKCMDEKRNIVIYGQSSSGKTTLLKCLSKMKSGKSVPKNLKEEDALNRDKLEVKDIVVETCMFKDGSRKVKCISE